MEMSEPKVSPQTVIGLGDANVDPEILTKEIDHDFFDDPPETTSSIDITECQQKQQQKDNLMQRMELSDIIANGKEIDLTGFKTDDMAAAAVAAMALKPALSSSTDFSSVRLDKSFRNYDELNIESGRSSSNVTLNLDVDKDQFGTAAGLTGKKVANRKDEPMVTGASEAEAECYQMDESNATSPNYPRPKQCYQLQQRRRSLGSIKKPGASCNATYDDTVTPSQENVFHPMNHNDCGLNGTFKEDDDDMISSSSSSSVASLSTSDSLSDSSESELESLTSDEDEFVDMLEKYFDYIDPDSDCSDLTEVSPLSSLSASPLPATLSQPTDDSEIGAVLMMADMNLISEDTDIGCCSDVAAIHATDAEGMGNEGLSSTAADAAYDRFEEDKRQNYSGAQEREKPKLPVFISTTEKIVISDDGLAAKGLLVPFNKVDDINNKPKANDLGNIKGGNNDFANFVCVADESTMDPTMSTTEINGTERTEIHSDSGNASSNISGASVDSSDQTKEEYFSPCASSTGSWALASGDNVGTDRAGSSSASSSSNATSSRGSGHSGSSGSNGRRPPKNYTFTPEQLRRIERENNVLLRKILDTSGRASGHHYSHRHRNGHSHAHHHHSHHHHKPTSSSSIARMKQLKRIECENDLLMKRLQTVKPSKEIGDAFCKPAAKN